jgi:hypothetical protein
MRFVVALAGLALLTVGTQGQAQAQSVEEFYKGKTINLAIGFSVGGGYDLYARHLARHMGRHIPGNPTIVPQNMAGAGSLRAANFIYTAAPKDGTAFGTFARTTGINPLLESGAAFDGTKFSWLGSVTDDVSLCITWHTTGIKTWGDFLKKPVTLGGQGPSSEPDIFARLYKNVFDAPIKLVPGYPGTNEITLAMERGEVDGLCGLSWSTIKTRHAQWLKDKKINLILQTGIDSHPELQNVPRMVDLARNDDERRLLLEAGYEIDRILTTDDLCGGEEIFFAASGVTNGALLRGVRYRKDDVITQSMVMRSKSGTVRYVESHHQLDKLMRFSGIEYR